jgi:GT2 family glycosyltransferase
MVYTSSICVDEDGNELNVEYKAGSSGGVYAEVAFFRPVTITLPTVMVRRDAITAVGLFDERMARFEDVDMWRRIAKRFAVGTIQAPTCRIRSHTGNILVNQNPEQIVDAATYYVEKISREDTDINEGIREAGIRRFCQHYAAALHSVPAFASQGDKLAAMARSHFRPLVSIIIPVYNGGDFFRQAIDSALVQTYPNLEFIVVNDGSIDGGETERLARSYRDRIRYFAKRNGGVASALNFGIEQMRGEYFSWLSHDDLYRPSKIDVQIGRLAECPEPSNAVIYGDYAVFSHDRGNAIEIHLPHTNPEDFRYFITTQNTLHGCTLLVPKAAFEKHGPFDSKLRTTQDYDLWFRMATTVQFIHYPAILVEARSHENQGTVRMSELVLQECNELLGNFVEKLSETEVCRSGALSLPLGYLVLSLNLRSRGFVQASERATKLARDALADMFAAHQEPSRVSTFLEELIRMMGESGGAKTMLSPLEELAVVGTEQKRKRRTINQHTKEALKHHFPAIVPLARTLRSQGRAAKRGGWMIIQRLKTAVKRHPPLVVPLVQTLRSKVEASRSLSQSGLLPDLFTRVYDGNYWGNAQSRSGSGSDLSQTAQIRVQIPALIRDLRIESILDIPCGDFFWMKECDLGIETDYIGADIVPGITADLNGRYGTALRRFMVLDLTKDPLPKVDLVLCRDVLVHFSFAHIRSALANLKRSGSTYLLTTTFTARSENLDIATGGDWRPLNLQIAPFAFPKPLRLINEGCTEYHNEFTDKSLGLWRLADL